MMATMSGVKFRKKDLYSTETRIQSRKLVGTVAEQFRQEILEQQPNIHGSAEGE